MAEKKKSEKELDELNREKTKNALEKEPKVTIRIPPSKKNMSAEEKKDDVVPVGINGCFMNIQRGEQVEVPQSVAKLLARAQYI